MQERRLVQFQYDLWSPLQMICTVTGPFCTSWAHRLNRNSVARALKWLSLTASMQQRVVVTFLAIWQPLTLPLVGPYFQSKPMRGCTVLVWCNMTLYPLEHMTPGMPRLVQSLALTLHPNLQLSPFLWHPRSMFNYAKKWYTKAIQQSQGFLIIFMCTCCPCIHALLCWRVPLHPFTFPSLRGAQRLCTELPGMARQGQGWVRDPHARHSTMLYSMQEGALSPNSAEGLMKHGRASREAT